MKYFLMVLQLIPALIEVIKAIEAAIPGRNQGEQKLAAIREIVETTFAEGIKLWPMLADVIATLVALFNKTGVEEFQKKEPPPVVPLTGV